MTVRGIIYYPGMNLGDEDLEEAFLQSFGKRTIRKLSISTGVDDPIFSEAEYEEFTFTELTQSWSFWTRPFSHPVFPWITTTVFPFHVHGLLGMVADLKKEYIREVTAKKYSASQRRHIVQMIGVARSALKVPALVVVLHGGALSTSLADLVQEFGDIPDFSVQPHDVEDIGSIRKSLMSFIGKL